MQQAEAAVTAMAQEAVSGGADRPDRVVSSATSNQSGMDRWLQHEQEVRESHLAVQDVGSPASFVQLIRMENPETQ